MHNTQQYYYINTTVSAYLNQFSNCLYAFYQLNFKCKYKIIEFHSVYLEDIITLII